MKKLILRILPFLIFSIFTAFAVNAQSFPQGSTQGTTTMTEKVTPVDMPLVDLSIRNPQNGQEVAFSVQVLKNFFKFTHYFYFFWITTS